MANRSTKTSVKTSARQRTAQPQTARRPRRKAPVKRIETTPPETEPAQEWGERIDTGKTIARGGKHDGFVPGATEQSPS